MAISCKQAAYTIELLFFALIFTVSCKPENQSTKVPQSGQLASPLVVSSLPVSPLPTPPPISTVPPIPTIPPAIPSVVAEPLIRTRNGNAFKLVYMPSAEWFSQPGAQGQLCDLRVSPDGKRVALTMCAETLSKVYLVDLASGNFILANISDATDTRLSPYIKPTWFRGWFPDSKHILLLSDWLEIRDIETGESRRITSKDETVTDAAVSPNGEKIVYTRIQGDMLKFIDVNGGLFASVLGPSPKPGNRPENLTWSPNGKWVAYTWDQGIVGYAGPLWIVDVDSNTSRQLSPPGVYDLGVTWAPDSTNILVSRRENAEDAAADFDPAKWISDLWIVTPDNNVWSQITHLQGKSAWGSVWVPDGSAVVFMSGLSDKPNAWMIKRDGTDLQQLTFDSRMMPAALGIAP